MHQACQDRVTHLQICLEAPVKLAAAVAPSRLFSPNLHITHYLPNVRTACARIASTSRTKVRLACVAPPRSYHSGLFGEISLDRALLQLSHVAAASCTVNFEFDCVSANQPRNCLSSSCYSRALSPNLAQIPSRPCHHLKVPAPPPATASPAFRPVQGRSPAGIKSHPPGLFCLRPHRDIFLPRPQFAFQVIYLHV